MRFEKNSLFRIRKAGSLWALKSLPLYSYLPSFLHGFCNFNFVKIHQLCRLFSHQKFIPAGNKPSGMLKSTQRLDWTFGDCREDSTPPRCLAALQVWHPVACSGVLDFGLPGLRMPCGHKPVSVQMEQQLQGNPHVHTQFPSPLFLTHETVWQSMRTRFTRQPMFPISCYHLF